MFVAPPISPDSRRAALEAMASAPLDVLVVGAGVVGAGAALDAVTRGLTVGLVEARDYGSGTSSRSSKLIHGGLRYLKQLDVPLVREALRERQLILERLCPHLARPVPFIYPLERRVWDRAYVGLGVGVYDLLGAGRGVPSHLKALSRRETLARFRSGRSVLRGGILFYEGQVDDARHTMMLARTAVAHGALAASSARVTGYLREGGRVVGVNVRDEESGADVTVRASVVINAAGVWTEELQDLLGGARSLRVQASKGVHLLVPRSLIDSDTGLITETEKSLLFVIPCPWSDEFWIIGTTDTAWDLDRAHPAASRADIDYILDRVNVLLERPLTRDDVVGVYVGLRPLLAGESDETSKLSRKHVVATPEPGLVIVAGGKYTTYRVMAADAVDSAAQFLPGPTPPSCTETVPLVGAEGYRALLHNRERLAAASGISVKRLDGLIGRYGTAVYELLDLIAEQPDLAGPVAGAPAYLRVEAHYAVSHEGALHLDDVLARRLRASVDTPSRGLDAAQEVARLVAPLLGWDAADIALELAHYRARVDAERDSQSKDDDLSADAARLGATDVRGERS